MDDPEPRVRVLIADGQTIVREGLRALLEGADGLEVAGLAASAAEAVRESAALSPDVVLIDAGEQLEGLGALRELKRLVPGARAVVLSAQQGERSVWAALQAGADGYVPKEAGAAELVSALVSVAQGRRFISPLVSAQIVARILRSGRPAAGAGDGGFETLTLREKQVLKMVAEGRRNREIAQALFISVKTVEKHRANVMSKLRVRSTAALTGLAMEKGLVARPGEAAEGGQ